MFWGCHLNLSATYSKNAMQWPINLCTEKLELTVQSLAFHPELTEAMKGSLCHEFKTGLPAAEVWEMYGGLRISQVVSQLLPDIFKKAELVDGDGGVGTVLHITFSHG